MKYFVITDSTDTQVGLRLAGIEGVVVREIPEARKAIQTAAADPEIAVLLVTENLAAKCSDLLETGSSFYFIMEDGQGLMLDKGELKGGSTDELRELLERKTGKAAQNMKIK